MADPVVVAAVTPPAAVVTPPAEAPKKDLSTFEQEQASQGWKPLSEWVADGGSEEDHRSAREFKDRGELLKRIQAQSGELKEVTRLVNTLSEHNKKVYVAGWENALKDLRAKRADAIENADGKALAQIEDAIDKTKDNLAAAKAQQTNTVKAPQGVTPEFQGFLDTNPWYNETATMRHWAHGMAIEFAKVNPDAKEADVYKFIAKEVRKDFPEKFERKGPPSPDGSGRSTSSSSSTNKGANAFEKLMDTLDEGQATAARSMVKRGLMTKEKYVEDYEAIGRNR